MNKRTILFFLALFFLNCGFVTTQGLCKPKILRYKRYTESVMPEIYKKHNSGIIADPTAEDVAAAILLGKNDIDRKACNVETPYLLFKDLHQRQYIFIETPLTLISEHARERTRLYNDLSQDYIDFCKNLNIVKIDYCWEKKYSDEPKKLSFILFRDGEKVKPLSKIKSFKGNNPFYTDIPSTMNIYNEVYKKEFEKKLNAIYAERDKRLEILKQNLGQYLNKEAAEKLPQALKENLEEADKITQSLGEYMKSFDNAASKYQTDSNANDFINVGFDMSGYFSIEELRKPGKYELLLPSVGYGETRIQISFDMFR